MRTDRHAYDFISCDNKLLNTSDRAGWHSGNVLDAESGGARFESQAKLPSIRTVVFLILLNPSKQMLGWYLD
jgi:hypothetical protein